MSQNPEISQPQSRPPTGDPALTAVRSIDVAGYEPATVFIPVEHLEPETSSGE